MSEGPDFSDLKEKEKPEGPGSSGADSAPHEGGEQEGVTASGPPEGVETNQPPSEKKYKNVEEVTFPSLDDAMNLKFDLNNVTSI